MLKKLVLCSVFLLMGSMAFAQSEEPTLRCRIDLPGIPMTFVKYFRSTHTASVESGFPRQYVEYSDVVETTGLPPYGADGMSLVAFGGDIPIITFKKTGAGKIWYELRETTYPFSAVWGTLPGAKAKSEGVCWTPDMPEEHIYYN
jgi:hypothetical protein